MLRKPSGVMVSSAVIHLTHTIYLHKQKFASIIGKDKINKAKAKKSVSIGGGACGDNARKHCSFYEKYKENLKTEESVIEQFTKADTKENWVANLKKKYRSMRQLYIENEALLNLYIRPFTEGRMELNDELADEFLKQIRDASAQGYEDSLSMLELAEFWSNIFLSMASVTIIFGRLICWEAFIMPCQIDRTEKRQPGIFKSFVLLRTVISRLKMTMSVLFGRNQLYRVS